MREREEEEGNERERGRGREANLLEHFVDEVSEVVGVVAWDVVIHPNFDPAHKLLVVLRFKRVSQCAHLIQ